MNPSDLSYPYRSFRLAGRRVRKMLQRFYVEDEDEREAARYELEEDLGLHLCGICGTRTIRFHAAPTLRAIFQLIPCAPQGTHAEMLQLIVTALVAAPELTAMLAADQADYFKRISREGNAHVASLAAKILSECEVPR